MPSRSYDQWKSDSLVALAALEAAHAAAVAGRRRRVATQINHAYTVLLSARFQAYCRDVHSEAVDHILNHLMPASLRVAIQRQLVASHKLDSGNPNPGNLGSDFGRLGVDLWPALRAIEPHTDRLRVLLEALNAWRNAVAHHEFDAKKLGGRTTLTLAILRRWRRACDRLVTSIDALLWTHLTSLVAVAPW